MSSFLGIVKEIPGISVDRFDDVNLGSSAFFLSHCHTDHMIGLNISFFNRLREKEQFLYCTNLSKLFLIGRYDLNESQSERIKTIVPCSPIIVDYIVNSKQESLTLVSVNAGHCPGSVMFIFERMSLAVLYTGDFRLNPTDLPKLKPLNSEENSMIKRPKKFDKIYIDTTFLSDNYKDFPSREESLVEIIRVAGNWILKDPQNIVVLECSARYGSEYIFIEVAKALKKRVHVQSCVYQDFSRVGELNCFITDDGKSTPLHACIFKRQWGGLKCRNVSPDNILTIVPSALRWSCRDLSKTISEWDPIDSRKFYVCVSMHSSYNELKAFIQYFDGSKFFACVQPRDSIASVQDKLDELTKTKVDNQDSKNYKIGPLKRKKSPLVRNKSRHFSSDDSSD